MRFKTIFSNTRTTLKVERFDTITGQKYQETLSKTDVWVGDEGSLYCVLELNCELWKKKIVDSEKKTV